MIAIKDHCDLCGICVAVCPANAITMSESRVHIDEEKCTSCGICIRICPVNALMEIENENRG